MIFLRKYQLMLKDGKKKVSCLAVGEVGWKSPHF